MPAFIVQPLVENAVKHGIAPLRAGGTVTIRARRHDEGGGTARLVLSVDDTGAGSTGEALERGRQAGVGLRNLERRLKLVGGDDARLDVTSGAGRGTCVTITVPLTDAPAATSPGDGVGAATRTSG